MEKEIITPFEWITSFSSLSKLLNPQFLFQSTTITENDSNLVVVDATNPNIIPRKVIHVGSGSSTLGESLLVNFDPYSLVINTDIDVETLNAMQLRWEQSEDRVKLLNKTSKDNNNITKEIQWVPYDFRIYNNDANITTDNFLPSKSFDLVLDKSMLDCALCSDDTTCGLLCKVYDWLKPDGIYFVVSFHHVDFILPMLRECPGANWDIEHFVVPRVSSDGENHICHDHNIDEITSLENECNIGDKQDPSSKMSDSVSLIDNYRKTVNVFICRRRSLDHDNEEIHSLDRNLVKEHILSINDSWFQSQHPLMTKERIQELETQFNNKLKFTMMTKNALNEESSKSISNDKNGLLSLELCYEILFTELERTHLTYEHFLEDWNAYLDDNEDLNLPRDGMTLSTAKTFLEAMQ